MRSRSSDGCAATVPPAPAASTTTHGALTIDDYRRLSWLRASLVAADHLAARGLPADREAARRLVFGLWLHATGRVDG